MRLANRIRQLRIAKNLSQGDVEAKTGLLRSYISRVEHGHIVPSVATLEKIASALETPLYRFFSDEKALLPGPTKIGWNDRGQDWASSGEGQRVFRKLRKHLSELNDWQRVLLLRTARFLAKSAKSTE